MKKHISIAFLIVLLISVFTGCAIGSNKSTNIEGKWQAYASMVDDQIVPFEDSFDEKTAEQLMSQSITFTDDGAVVIKNGDVSLDGTYESLNDGYVITQPFGDSGETATLNCTLYDDDLIVLLNPPEGFEDFDSGDPTVYRKAVK